MALEFSTGCLRERDSTHLAQNVIGIIVGGCDVKCLYEAFETEMGLSSLGKKEALFLQGVWNVLKTVDICFISICDSTPSYESAGGLIMFHTFTDYHHTYV